MKLYKIIVVDEDTGKVVDTFEGVRNTDLTDSSPFLASILEWLRRTIRQ